MHNTKKILVVLKETKDGVKYVDSASERESLGELIYKNIEKDIKQDNLQGGDVFYLGAL